MAEKKPIIVIKKITVAGAGHHGGSWKVALADFMTALMAFFLVMWLLAQSAESKKAVSDYFSTPSIIEYNFQNFGAELTLEKLFLDLVNEPLKAFEQFMEPADKTPNILDFGSAKVVTSFVADNMREMAKNYSVTEDGFEFDIPDYELFKPGTADPNQGFVDVMEKLKTLTTGLEESNVNLTSLFFVQAVREQNPEAANRVAAQRADLVAAKVKAGLEHNTVTVSTGINVKDKKGEIDPGKLVGFIRVKVSQKPVRSDGKKPRKLDTLFGDSKADMSVYDNFVSQAVNSKSKKDKEKK
ncbi:MAG: chemotaxis protein MotB [Bdellovibrionaceae bacterium]|nr:chemotaxis protein MotB [Pseudobdellovibrionaceae bacterium]MBX3032583.1 chemotaxis protein MotB [Pseudobdellovibrionaceae bacterium]